MFSILLLDSTTTELNVTGQKQRGAGFSTSIGSSHTVSISVSNFLGRVYIEGSLATDPGEIDWFPISLIPNFDYIEYPRDRNKPTGSGGGDTSTLAFSFSGNYIWIRARIDRDYLIPYPQSTIYVGAVNQILLNYGSVAPATPVSYHHSGWPGSPGPSGPEGPTGPIGPTGASPSLFGNIIPSSDNVYTLGNSTNRWNHIYVGPGSITVGNIIISENNGLLSTATSTGPSNPVMYYPMPSPSGNANAVLSSDGNNLIWTENGGNSNVVVSDSVSIMNFVYDHTSSGMTTGHFNSDWTGIDESDNLIIDTQTIRFNVKDINGYLISPLFDKVIDESLALKLNILDMADSENSGVFLTTTTSAIESNYSYKGFIAGVCRIYGDDPSINQILISTDSISPNYTADLTNQLDTFGTDNFSGSPFIALINLYNSNIKPINYAYLWEFFTKFVDVVLVDSDNNLYDIDTIKLNFYTNFAELTSVVPPLYSNFIFEDKGSWPYNYINDGGDDQYDGGNYLNTNLASEIPYAGGEVVADSSSYFGSGSSYVTLYNDSIFALIGTNVSISSFHLSGNLGSDGNGTTDVRPLVEIQGYEINGEMVKASGNWVTSHEFEIDYSISGTSFDKLVFQYLDGEDDDPLITTKNRSLTIGPQGPLTINPNGRIYLTAGSGINDNNINGEEIEISSGEGSIHSENYLGYSGYISILGANGIERGTFDNISNITRANPARVSTTNSHMLDNGSLVYIFDVNGMTQINNKVYYVTVITSNSFYLYEDEDKSISIDSRGFDPYESGGMFQAGMPGGSVSVSAGTSGVGSIKGRLVLNEMLWPRDFGSSGQVLSTNGTGSLSWSTISEGGSSLSGILQKYSTTPSGGGLSAGEFGFSSGLDSFFASKQDSLGNDISQFLGNVSSDTIIYVNGTDNKPLAGYIIGDPIDSGNYYTWAYQSAYLTGSLTSNLTYGLIFSPQPIKPPILSVYYQFNSSPYGISVPPGTPTIIPYNQVMGDTNNGWNNSLSSYTIPKAGWWNVMASSSWNISSTVYTNLAINGNDVRSLYAGSGQAVSGGSTIWDFNQGDIVTIRVTQMSVSNAILYSGQFDTYLNMTWIRN